VNAFNHDAVFPLAPDVPATLDSSRARAATAVAVLAGTCYALSPLTLALGSVIAALIWWACRGLSGRERRWTMTLLIGSLLVRGAAIGAIALTADPWRGSFRTFYGDGQYALERSMWLRNALLGTPMSLLDLAEAFHTYARSIYYYPLAWLQVLFGPAPYALHLTSVVGYFAAAIALYRLVRSSYGHAAAFAGLSLVLCVPTLLLRSMAPLKESLYFSMSSLAVVSTARMIRARRWTGAAGALVSAGIALAVAASLRTGGLAMALGGLVAGLLIAATMTHRRVVIAAIVGVPIAAALAVRQPVVLDAFVHQVRQGVATHIGYFHSAGSNYRLLDGDDFYNMSRPFDSLTGDEAVRYVGRAVRDFVLLPKPWAPTTRSDVAMVPQQLIWYALLIFSVPGFVAGLRRDALLTGLLFGTALVGAAAIALASGNVGTLIRHRDMIVPFVVWIGALGAIVTMNRCATLVWKEGK